MMRKTVIGVAVLIISPILASATIINIPSDYPHIQQGINASSDGDTVLVQPGTYYENINFNGHNIVLGSLYLTTGDTSYIGQTVIDGDSAGSVVTFESGEDSGAKITGFTIQNGDAIQGGGIYCRDSNPQILQNSITGNIAVSGGGIYWENCSPPIRKNRIYGNIGTHGGGLYCYQSNSMIRNNVIVKNPAGLGGGIRCMHSSPLLILNNTISMNGGGISCYYSQPHIINNIIWYNSGDEIYAESGSPYVSYCDVQGGWEGEGNIDIDPMFSDPFNDDFNVCSQSPCIDSGDPNLIDPDSTRSDMGVYYSEHLECDIGNLWYVSTTGNDTTGDGSFENPFRTIQHAIDISFLQDTILALPGIYYENISYYQKSVMLASNFIFSNDTLDIINTVMEGDSTGPVVDMVNTASTSKLIGITIRSDNTTSYPAVNISNGRIESSLFVQNSAGSISGGSNIELINNTFRYNDSTIIIELFADPYTANITGNRFYQNLYSVVLFTDAPGIQFKNNEIYENIGVIFHCWMIGYGNWGQAVFRGNLIYNNHCPWSMAGGIFSSEDSNILSENNIICNNSGVPGSYLAYFFEEHSTGCPVLFNNNIIWGNVFHEDSLIYIWDVNFSMSYSDIQNGWSGIGNIDVDPLFRDPDNGDFHLMSTACGDPYDSPCIDAGDPAILDSLLDCSWGLGSLRSDMGAYGGGDTATVGIWDSPSPLPERYLMIRNYPNPFNQNTTIEFDLPVYCFTTIDIYDVLGREVENLLSEIKPPGSYFIKWDARDRASGIYFYKLEACGHTRIGKMVLLR